MFDILSTLSLLLKILGQDEKIRDVLVNLNPAEVVFSDFMKFGSEKMIDFSWDSTVTYIWVVFIAVWIIAFYQIIVGGEKASGVFSDYIFESRVNRKMFTLIPESIIKDMKGTSWGYLMVIIASIFKPGIYIAVATACSWVAIWLMGDAVLTIFFEAFARSDLLAIPGILADVTGFAGILILQMIFVALGLYMIPLIEAGKASEFILAEGAERFFWLNLPIPFLVALCFNVGAANLGGPEWYNGLIGGGLMTVGKLIPWIMWIGSWVETILKVLVGLVLLLLAAQGVPVGPIQESLKYGLKHGVTKTALSYGDRKISDVFNRDKRTRPTQMDDTPMQGGI